MTKGTTASGMKALIEYIRWAFLGIGFLLFLALEFMIIFIILQALNMFIS